MPARQREGVHRGLVRDVDPVGKLRVARRHAQEGRREGVEGLGHGGIPAEPPLRRDPLEAPVAECLVHGERDEGEGGEVARYGGGHIDSLGDHRIAMAFAIAALRAGGEIVIDDCANVATSFPGFIDLARRVGLALEEQQEAS